MIDPIVVNGKSVTEDNVGTSGINFKKFTQPSSVITAYPQQTETLDDVKKKRTSTKKKKIGNDEVVTSEEEPQELNMLQSNRPYIETYQETNNMVRGIIAQADMLYGVLQSDLEMVRSSKTLKSKYQVIPLLTGSMSSTLSTKLSAVKEMNKTIHDSHNLDMKRVKELKLNDRADQDDSKYISDMYSAFISLGPQNGMTLGPSPTDISIMGSGGIVRVGGDDEEGYNNYINNLSPAQNAMRYENTPVKTVVMYEQSSGRRWFANINIETGQEVSNLPVPDAMFLDDTIIDLHNQVARNTNLDKSYPLVVIQDNTLSQY